MGGLIERQGGIVANEDIKVLYLDHSAALSGAELALLRLLPHVPGVSPHVVLAEDGPLVGRLAALGISVEVLALAGRTGALRRDELGRQLPLRAVWDVLRYTTRLTRRIRQLRPDVVHTNSNKSHLYGGVAARLAGVPQVWHARDRTAVEFMPPRAVALVRRAARMLPRLVIANSTATLHTLPGARHPRAGSAVLRDPVVTDDFVAAGERPAGAAPGAGPADVVVVVVGMLGRLTPWKGQDLFLRAYAEAIGSDPGVRAVIVGSAMFGEDDYAASLHQLVEELGITDRVEFAGFHSDVPGVLAGMDVLVHASVIPEPFGQVVIEGMAAGLPVLASGEGGPAEVVTDGVDGLLFTPRDAASLAARLVELVGDPVLRRRLGEAARDTSRDYAPGPLGEQLLGVYQGVLA